MIKIKTKNLKPIDADINLIYSCPKCSSQHWLSIKEAKTKGFKVVCDCDTVFTVRSIKQIKVIYEEDSPDLNKIQQQPQIPREPKVEVQEIGVELLAKACKILVGYGFTKTESENLIRSTFSKNPTDDCALLVKNSLAKLGENHCE
jgi:hypothetical protein